MIKLQKMKNNSKRKNSSKNELIVRMKFLLSPLWLLVFFVLGWEIIFYAFSMIRFRKIYYYPEIDTFIRVYRVPYENYGYIYLSKDKDSLFSENCDRVKVAYGGEQHWYYLVVNPLEDHLYSSCRNGAFIEDFNSVYYTMEIDNVLDSMNHNPQLLGTIVFDQEIGFPGEEPLYLLKPPYVQLAFDNYLNSVWYTNEWGTLEELMPIKF